MILREVVFCCGQQTKQSGTKWGCVHVLSSWSPSNTAPSHPTLLRYNWHIKLWKIKVYKKCDTYILQNYCHCRFSYYLHHVTCNNHFFFVIRTFKIYSLSNFQGYNTEVSTIITILYIRSPASYSSYNWSFLLWPTSPLFPSLLPAPGNHHSSLCFYEFRFFRLHI